MKLTRTVRVLAVLPALLAGVADGAHARPDPGDPVGATVNLTVDVAEVGGLRGSVGYLYPAGTLETSNGVRADGTPEFPDKVIGRWMVLPWSAVPPTSAARRPRPATHVFRFATGAGATLLIEGDDGAAVAPSVVWAVTGGAGRYGTARGTAREFELGRNKARGRNLRVTFDLGR